MSSVRRVDPETGKASTAANAIPYTTYSSRKKVDPNTGEPSTESNAISYTVYRSKIKVDPSTGEPSTASDAITISTYRSRKKVDPDTGEASSASNAISYNAYNKRKKVDPNTGESSTDANAISYTVYRSRNKVDPDTGESSTAPNTISYNAYCLRKKVDPDTGESSTAPNAISYNAYCLRKKVDPDTGEPSTAPNAISYSAYYKRKKVDPDTGESSTAPNTISYGAYHQKKKRQLVVSDMTKTKNKISRTSSKIKEKSNKRQAEQPNDDETISSSYDNQIATQRIHKKSNTQSSSSSNEPNITGTTQENLQDIEIKSEPITQARSFSTPTNRTARINDDQDDGDLSPDPILVSSIANLKFDLTHDDIVGPLDALDLTAVSNSSSPRYDINAADDIHQLVANDKLDAYLSHATIPTPPVEIKSVYAIPGAKGVFAKAAITDLNQPLGDYLGEAVEYPNSAYIFATATASIDALRQRNWTAYLNHSVNPNVHIEELADGTIRFYSARAIKAGEQLTINYGLDYFKCLGFSPCYLHKHDDEQSDAAKIVKHKSAYHPNIIRWTNPDLDAFFAITNSKQELKNGCYVVPQLFFAIINNDIAYLLELLKTLPADCCAYAVEPTPHGFKLCPPSEQEHITPLMLAAYCGRVEIIKLLIDAGADVNRQMLHRGTSALSIIVDSAYDKTSLADFLVNERHDKIEILPHLLQKKNKILNFIMQTPLRNQTIANINTLLMSQREKEQITLKKFLHRALATIGMKLFQQAPLPIVSAIWAKIIDQSHQDAIVNSTTVKFKALKKAYTARQRALKYTSASSSHFSLFASPISPNETAKSNHLQKIS